MPRNVQQSFPGPNPRAATPGPLKRARLRPSARPTDTYWQPNNTGPDLPAFVDLAPLSKAIQNAVFQKVEAEGENMRQQAIAAIPDSPEAQERVQKALDGASTSDEGMKRLQREFAKEIEANPALEMGNPFAQIGFAEKSALIVMRQYEADLADARSRVSALVNEEGLPAEAEQPESVEQEVWDKYKDNVAIQTGPGSRIANAKRAEIESRWRAQVIQERANNQRELSHMEMEILVSDELAGWLAVSGPLTSKHTASLEQALVRHGQERGMVQLQDDFVSGLASRVRATASDDPAGARKILENALEIRLPYKGSKRRASEFPQVQDEAARLFESIQRAERSKDEQDDRIRDRKLKYTTDVTYDVGLDFILDGLKAGEAPESLVNAAVDKVMEDDGVPEAHRGRVDSMIRDMAAARNNDDPSPQAAQWIRDNVALGVIGRDEIVAAKRTGLISLHTMAEELGNAKDRESRMAWLESNPHYATVRNGLARASAPIGAGPVQTKQMAEVVAQEQDTFSQEMTNWLRSLRDEQDVPREPTEAEHRDMVTKLGKEAQERIKTRRIELETEYQSATEALDEAARARDVVAMQSVLDSSGTVLSTQDRKDARVDMERIAQSWDTMIDRAPSFQFGMERLSALQDGVLKELEGDPLARARAVSALGPSFQALRRDARAAMRTAFKNNPSNPGAAIAEAYGAIQTIADNLVDKAEPILKEQRERSEAAEEGVTAEVEAVSQTESFRQDAKDLGAAQAQGRYAEQLRTQSLTGWVRPDLDVPKDLYDSFEKWQTNLTDSGRRVVQREGFESEATSAIISLWNDEQIPEDRRVEAVGSILRLRGLDASEVIAGTVDVQVNPGTRSLMEAELRTINGILERPLSARVPNVSRLVRRKAAIETKLAGAQVPVDTASIQPYLTPIRGVDWDAHDEDPTVRKLTTELMSKLKLTEAQREEFITFQADANERTER